jgi:hypothetical protein
LIRTIVRRRAFLYAAITLLLPLFVGFAIGQVWSSFSFSVGETVIIEVKQEDIVEHVTVFPESVTSQLEQVPGFNRYVSAFLGILTNNVLLLTFLLLLPLVEVLEEYALNKSNWYRNACNNVSSSLPNFPQPYAAISIIFGIFQGLVAGWILSSFPLSVIFNAPIVPASIELLIFILAIAFLYEVHLQKNLTSETTLALYKNGKNYFAVIYVLIIVAALVETYIIEMI